MTEQRFHQDLYSCYITFLKSTSKDTSWNLEWRYGLWLMGESGQNIKMSAKSVQQGCFCFLLNTLHFVNISLVQLIKCCTATWFPRNVSLAIIHLYSIFKFEFRVLELVREIPNTLVLLARILFDGAKWIINDTMKLEQSPWNVPVVPFNFKALQEPNALFLISFEFTRKFQSNFWSWKMTFSRKIYPKAEACWKRLLLYYD